MNTQTLPLEAILYGRVSTNKQETSRQDFMLAEMCRRYDLTPILAEKDEDVSGSVPFAHRRGGHLVLQAVTARRGKPFAFVTTEQDRIGRDTVDIINTIRLIWQAGGTPYFAAEGGAIPRTPENEMRMEIRATLAQYEKNKIKQRITTKMEEKRAANQLCGTVPYGWDAVESGEVTAKGVKIRKLVDNPAEQRWILHMDQLRRAGHGYHTIAKDLNSRGVPTKRRGEFLNLLRDGTTRDHVEKKFTSGRWQAGNVANVLKNKTVIAWLGSVAEAQAA